MGCCCDGGAAAAAPQLRQPLMQQRGGTIARSKIFGTDFLHDTWVYAEPTYPLLYFGIDHTHESGSDFADAAAALPTSSKQAAAAAASIKQQHQ